MSKITVKHEFDTYEEYYDLMSLIQRHSERRDALLEIDNSLRRAIKHAEDTWLHDEKAIEYLESIREVIRDVF